MSNLKDKIITDITTNSSICIDQEIKELSHLIRFEANTGDTNWFDVSGDSYGVHYGSVVMDFEGCPLSQDDLNKKSGLVAVLIAADNVVASEAIQY
jgi:hypothetical protein